MMVILVLNVFDPVAADMLLSWLITTQTSYLGCAKLQKQLDPLIVDAYVGIQNHTDGAGAD